MINQLFIIQIKNDFKSILRDPFLRYLTLVPLILALTFVALQNNIVELFANYNIDYYQYSDLLISFLILTIGPSMFGILYGFMILDYKDERIFDALALTPVGNAKLLLIKLTVPYALSVIITILSVAIVTNTIPIWLLIAVVLLSGLNAPFYALILGVIAKNKIQGMSVQKVSGILMIIPIISYFFKSNYILLLGIDPLFWVFQSYWLIKENNFLAISYIVIGIVYYLLNLSFLVSKLG